MKRALILFSLFLFAAPVFGQTVMNFDANLSGDRADIIIQPPPGKTWTLIRGWFWMTNPPEGTSVSVFEQVGDDSELTGYLIHHGLQSIRQHSGYGYVNEDTVAMVPIIGGYMLHPEFGQIRGLPGPIVLEYPNRLVIHLHRMTVPRRGYARFRILEEDTLPVTD